MITTNFEFSVPEVSTSNHTFSQSTEEFAEGFCSGIIMTAATHLILSRLNIEGLKPLLNTINLFGSFDLCKKIVNGDKFVDSIPKLLGEITGSFVYGGIVNQLCRGFVGAVGSPRYSVFGENNSGIPKLTAPPVSELTLAFRNNERKIIGHTRSEYLACMREYGKLTGNERITYSLKMAKQNGAGFIHHVQAGDGSFFFSHSPLGAHKTDFLRVREVMAAMPEFNQSSLRISCYGGGFNHTPDFLEGALSTTSGARSMIPGLRNAERRVFPLGGQSNEPRELAAIFLHDRPGEISVFDVDSRVIQNLRSSKFIRTDTMSVIDALVSNPLRKGENRALEEYWYQEILRGRSSELQPFLKTERGSFYFDIADFPENLKRIKATEACLVTSPKIDCAANPFDLSVWLDSYYLLPEPLQKVALARVVRNTRLGGLILTDSGAFEEVYGLKYIQTITSHDLTGTLRQSSHLYQKVANTEEVELISRLLVG